MLLTFKEAEKILKKYKIPVITTGIISNEKEAIEFSKKSRFPLVLKLDSPYILHKTDIGGVILDIKNEKELKSSWRQISKLALKYKGKVLVQKQIPGIYIIMGAKKDPVFGPLVMFGLGGIFVEILKDVSFRLAPITKTEARKMIKEIKGYKILKGYRGQKPVDIDALSKILANLSKMIAREKNIREVDLNPVIVNEKEAQVVDVKIITNSKFKIQPCLPVGRNSK